MGKEPIITEPNPAGQGRPIISDEQYKIWLELMRPHLELACSLYRACCKAGLEDRYDSCILEKYNSKDWFSRKVDTYRAQLGDNINEVMARITNKALDKSMRSEELSREDIDVVKHMSEKHRSAQPFFVTRTETAEAKDKDLGKILDTIEATNYEQLGQQARRQMVEADTPIQNQGQAGPDSDIPAEPPTA